MTRLADQLSRVVTTSGYEATSFDSFAAHEVGYCRRQAYLTTLGLRDVSEYRGRLDAGRIVQEHIQSQLADAFPKLDVAPQLSCERNGIQIHGRPTCVDRTEEVVYQLKPRDAWYKFNPPIDRHLQQLHAYLGMLEDIDRGQLLYINMADLADLRPFPDPEPVAYDDATFEKLIEKAVSIKSHIISNGVATCHEELPFEKCGCYLCQTEEIVFPETGEHAGSQSSSNPTDPSQARRDKSNQQPGPSGTASIETAGYHVPTNVQEHEVFVLWDGRQKIPLAPWKTETMYPAEWGPETSDPRVSYRTARMIADLPIQELHESYPFPDEDNLPTRVEPAVLLPHSESPLVVVDIDDVRTPTTGETAREAVKILDWLDSYAEVSVSGSGFHVYVWGSLPAGTAPFQSPLDACGSIEMYETSRFVGSTWRQVEDSPDTITAGAQALDAIIDQYGTDRSSESPAFRTYSVSE